VALGRGGSRVKTDAAGRSWVPSYGPESVNDTVKGQLDLERHGHTPAGVLVRVLRSGA
jgi:hypothetical protein